MTPENMASLLWDELVALGAQQFGHPDQIQLLRGNPKKVLELVAVKIAEHTFGTTEGGLDVAVRDALLMLTYSEPHQQAALLKKLVSR